MIWDHDLVPQVLLGTLILDLEAGIGDWDPNLGPFCLALLQDVIAGRYSKVNPVRSFNFFIIELCFRKHNYFYRIM
jgi:hypothetical protein